MRQRTWLYLEADCDGQWICLSLTGCQANIELTALVITVMERTVTTTVTLQTDHCGNVEETIAVDQSMPRDVHLLVRIENRGRHVVSINVFVIKK